MSIAVEWGTGFLKGNFPSAGGFAPVLAKLKKKNQIVNLQRHTYRFRTKKAQKSRTVAQGF